MSGHPKSLSHHVTVTDPYKLFDVLVTTVSDRNAVVATATFEGRDGNSLHATGSAKRSPGDPLSDAGEMLSIGRALTALGQYFEESGNRRVDEK